MKASIRVSLSLSLSFLALFAALFAACSSTTIVQHAGVDSDAASDPTGDDASDAPEDASAPSDTGSGRSETSTPTAPLACGANKVTNQPTPVDKRSGQPGTTPAGGNVADGHYVATGFTMYGTTGLVGNEAADLWIASGRFEWEEDDDQFGVFGDSGKITFSGHDVLLAEDCTKNNRVSPTFAYTASGTSLTLFEATNGGGTLVIEMSR